MVCGTDIELLIRMIGKVIHRILIGVSVMLLVYAVCSEAAEISYTDKMGRTVGIPVPVERAVLFQPAELIPALDIWDKVVGVGRYSYDSDLLKASKPDIEKTIPSAGSGSDVNIEQLLKAKPDLVITWSYYPDQVKFMEEKGLRVIALYLDTISEMYDAIRLLGKLFAKETKADSVILQTERIFSLITGRVSKIPSEKRKKVLWLYGKPTQAAGNGDLFGDVIRLIGGINAAPIDERHAEVSLEQIVVWNPDIIFIWGNAGYSARSILDNPQWRFIRAVKEARIYKTPKWSSWSPRLAPMALWMAKKTYPEHFEDIHAGKVTDEFFITVFGIPYSQVKQFDE